MLHFGVVITNFLWLFKRQLIKIFNCLNKAPITGRYISRELMSFGLFGLG